MDPVDRTTEMLERQLATTGMDRTAVVKRPLRMSPKCLDCSNVIPAERLALVPDARRCTSCQAEHEERERRLA